MAKPKKKVNCANSTKSFKNITNRTIMPKFGHFYNDEIQGQSLSQGHSKDSVGISSSIRLLLLNSVSIEEMLGTSFLVLGFIDAWPQQYLMCDIYKYTCIYICV